MLIKNLFLKTSEKYSQNISIVDDINFITYKELFDLVENISEKLNSFGIKKGSKVAVLIDNPKIFIIFFLAIAYTEGIILPIYFYTGNEKIKEILKEFDVDYIISNKNNIENEGEKIKFNIFEKEIVCVKKNFEKIDNFNYLEDVELILFSSGTTNTPKGIMLTTQNIKSNIEGISDYLKLNEKDKILIIKNFNNASTIIGELLVGIYNGCEIHVTSILLTSLNIIKIIDKKNITVFFGVPTLLKWMIESEDIKKYKFKYLKIINFYGAPMLNEDILKLINFFPETNIIYSYGLTEASPRVTYIEKKDLLLKKNSSGKPIKNVEIFVCDKDEKIKKNGFGEILVKGKNVMKGYYKNKILTEYTLKNNFLYTGDIGYIDIDGFLYVRGRKDNMIVSLGRNIHVEEIEEVIYSYYGILEVLVKVEEKDNYILDIVAYIVLKEGVNLKKIELQRYCSEKLENYKVPNEFIIKKFLEKTSSGKIKRKIFEGENEEINS